MAADDPDKLAHYQFGPYLFSKERDEHGEARPEGGTYPPQTRYTMARQPNEMEREGLGEDWAPAFDVGTMDVIHHPPAEHFPRRRIIGNAAAEREWTEPAIGAEGTGRVVHSKSFHEKYSPRDEVDFLTVAKPSRLMVPTMLGLGQRAAKETTGQDLAASTSLSKHSQRLVDKLKAVGMVPETHTSTPNQLTFTTAWPMSTPGGLEGHFSTLMARRKREGDTGERPIPATEVAAAQEEGREMVRKTRPKRAS